MDGSPFPSRRQACREKEGIVARGQDDPLARWVAFVGALPRWFAPPITTVPAEGPSAEWFDRSLPRHPPEGGPGAEATRLLDDPARTVTTPFRWSHCSN